MPISTRQAKAARALLAWSQEDLARASGVSIPTVKRLEAEDGPVGGRADTGAKLQAALETAGVIFIDENGEGPGVRLRKKSSAPNSGASSAFLHPVCVHEAGHCIALIYTLKKFPLSVTIDLSADIPHGHTAANLGSPTDGHSATRFAEYFFAGKEAVALAIIRGKLPPEVDPLHGFSDPVGDENDSALIEKLKIWHPDLHGAEINARRLVNEHWPAIVKLASRFASQETIDGSEIRSLLL